jgi:hypothetical protein
MVIAPRNFSAKGPHTRLAQEVGYSCPETNDLESIGKLLPGGYDCHSHINTDNILSVRGG